ncbi:MAG: hypothetical protein SFU98_06520 [Leptospiraceae bacterium]|nr:hypothetical protein [Leptospiraceae bacterium]
MKKLIYLSITLSIFLFTSIVVNVQRNSYDLSKLQLKLNFSGTEKAFAAASDWGFVRGSANWARGNSNIIDSLLGSLKTSGVFDFVSRLGNDASQTFLNQPSSNGLTYNYRLKVNSTFTLSATAYTGTKTYKHRFEMFRVGDTSSQPALQMYFSDVNGTGTSGVLLYYNLTRLDPNSAQFKGADAVIVESYVSGNSGTLSQTYTWANGPKTSLWPSDNGRVILNEVIGGKQLCFRSVVRLNTKLFIDADPTNGPAIAALCGGTNVNIYYNLAYMQKFDSPFQTTAKFGLTNTATPGITTICNTPGKGYGIFREAGFVADGLTAAQVNTQYSDYPSPDTTAVSPNVDGAFLRTGTDNGTSGGYDDTSKTFIDGLSTNANLNFKATDPKP